MNAFLLWIYLSILMTDISKKNSTRVVKQIVLKVILKKHWKMMFNPTIIKIILKSNDNNSKLS